MFAHRWLGVAGCLLFLVWFISGIAMVYVRMPELSRGERLGHAAPLAIERIQVRPAEAAATIERPPAPVELGMLGDRPVYRFEGRKPRVVYADSNAPVATPTPETAITRARAFVGAHGPAVRLVDRLDTPDQWSLQLRAHFPLYRLAVDDGAGTELYVSSRTADVVLDTTRHERLLAYLGPVTHWLYLPVLRRNGALWTQVVIWTSGIGCVLCLSGLVIGVLRASPRRSVRVGSARALTPYSGWLEWHHYAGLVFGLVTFTWTFSGLLSMGPFAWLSHQGNAARVARLITGDAPPAPALTLDDVQAATRALQAAIPIREMRQVAFLGRWFWLGTGATGVQRLVAATHPWTVLESLPRADVEAAARQERLGPVVDLTWLTAPDDYYYDRDSPRGLPVLRARYADAAATWMYLDPATGEVAMVVGRADRLNRWLYHGLHSLDPAWLRSRRPWWDVVVIVLSLGGIAAVVTILVPAWRRLRRAVGG